MIEICNMPKMQILQEPSMFGFLRFITKDPILGHRFWYQDRHQVRLLLAFCLPWQSKHTARFIIPRCPLRLKLISTDNSKLQELCLLRARDIYRECLFVSRCLSRLRLIYLNTLQSARKCLLRQRRFIPTFLLMLRCNLRLKFISDSFTVKVAGLLRPRRFIS